PHDLTAVSVEDPRRSESPLSIRIVIVTGADQRNVAPAHERSIAIQPCKRRIASTDSHAQAHARGGPRYRFGRRVEVGVCVDVREADVGEPARCTEQRTKHDAAVTTE